jgi:hypothetical protein
MFQDSVQRFSADNRQRLRVNQPASVMDLTENFPPALEQLALSTRKFRTLEIHERENSGVRSCQ